MNYYPKHLTILLFISLLVGDPTFLTHQVGTADGAASVHTADLDGDGDTDILCASRTDDHVRWYENNGSESFTAHTISNSASYAYSVYAVDIDNDGDMDVLSASLSDKTIAWYENDGSESFTEHAISTTADGARLVHPVDMDDDGDMDVLSAASQGGITWYQNDGSESFATHIISDTLSGAWYVHAADVDGDGDMDVLSASKSDDKVAWYENNGSENFTEHAISTTADGAYAVKAVDIDSDGDMDVISGSYIDNKVAWYENNGSESFIEHVISTTASYAFDVYAADVDGDGDMDVLSACKTAGVFWYDNDGSENFTTHTLHASTTDQPISVYVGDVDSDGDLDVLSAHYVGDFINWYEQEGTPVISNSHPVASDLAVTTAEDTDYSGTATATDVNGDTLSYSILAVPSHGTATMVDSSAGTFTYSPNTNYNGNDSFTFTASDGSLLDTATVTVTITPVDDAPVAVDETVSMDEDTRYDGFLSGSDPDIDALAYNITSQPANGSVLGSSDLTAEITQLGDDLVSPTVGNMNSFGQSVSLSSDGLRMAVGDPYNNYSRGYAKVYEFVGGNWIQLGQTVNGSGMTENTGWSVSLSSDGSRLAVGSPDGGNNVHGRVIVYDLIDSTWTPVGDYFQGYNSMDRLGATLSLSGDGSRVAMGAPNQYYSQKKGYVTVYERVNNTWTKMDTTYLGYSIGGENDYGYFGKSISMSEDGSRLAVGAGGEVKIFDYANGVWTLVGGIINGRGDGVSISADGSRVAVAEAENDEFAANAGAVKIYDLINNTWTQVGNAIYGSTAGDALGGGSSTTHYYGGQGISLSSDGSRVAVGSRTYTDANGDYIGQVRVFELINGSWAQVLDDVYGDPETSCCSNFGAIVSLNVNGFRLAAGAPGRNITSGDGYAQVFNVPSGISGNQYSYIPYSDYSGTDSFTFTVSDGNTTDEGTITITVNNVNDPPYIYNSSFTINEDTQYSDTLVGGDIDGDVLIYSILSAPGNGTAFFPGYIYVGSSDGTFTYVPDNNYHGSDFFTLTVSDGTLSDTAEVSVTVTSVSDAPVAADLDIFMDEDSTFSGTLHGTDGDGDAITYSIVTLPSSGAAVLLDSLDGTFTHTPNANYNGSDSFTYRAGDGTLSDTGTVSITVHPVNDAPVINRMSDATMDEDSEITLTLPSVSDIDGDSLSFSVDITLIEAYLTFDFMGDTALKITAYDDWYGSEDIPLVVSDGDLEAVTTFTLTVLPVDDVPFVDGHINPLNYPEDFPLDTVANLENVFTDIDGELTYSYEMSDSNLVTIDIAGGFLMVSSLDDVNGSAEMFLTAMNPLRASVTDTVEIHVWPVNDAPTVAAVPDTSMDEDSEFIFDISDYINDIDSEELLVTVDIVSSNDVDYLDVSMHGPDTLHIFSHDNWHGSKQLEIIVSDGDLDASTFFTLTVDPVNDVPFFDQSSAIVGVGEAFSVLLFAHDIEDDSASIGLDPSFTYPEWLTLSPRSPYELSGTVEEPLDIDLPLILTDNDTSVTAMFYLAARRFQPVISAVVDVPGDQGGRVYVSFQASFYDHPDERDQSYSVMRYESFGETPGWVMLQSLNAIGEQNYIYEVATVRDSTAENNGMTDFKIVASMHAGIYHSEPHAGYSVDNIAPGIPLNLQLVANPTTITATWSPSEDEDFQYFELQRSSDASFSAGSMVSFEMVDTVYTDVTVDLGMEYYYRVAAFDYAGNSSGYSGIVSASALNVDLSNMVPDAFVVHQNYPNPFNPVTTLRYDLPTDAMVNITIYDMMGRVVKTMVNGKQNAGFKSVRWNATNDLGDPVSAGLYMYIIQAGEFRQTKKMVLLK